MATLHDNAPVALPEPARRRLHSLLHTLRDIEGTVIVAAHALEAEEGFVGMCAARLLRTQVSHRLSVEIDRTARHFAIEPDIERNLLA